MTRPTKLDRCTGHCCRRLTIAMSPAELQRNAAFSRAVDAHKQDPTLPDPLDDARFDGARNYLDIERIADMLVPLGFELIGDSMDHETFPGGEGPRWWYACRHLQANGDCGIYAERPSMCSDYPGKYRCGYKACTWQHARSLPIYHETEEMPVQ